MSVLFVYFVWGHDPLYPLFSSTAPGRTLVERRLSRWLQLGERWGAVILIDEADVYLDRRSSTDLQWRVNTVLVLRSCSPSMG